MTPSTAELGVYILGATALFILAGAGIYTPDATVLLCAVLASGAAYLSQVCAVWVAWDSATRIGMWGNGLLMLAAIGAWCVGVWFLVV